MNLKQVQTILECLNLLNHEITYQKITTPATLSVFMKLMEIELGLKKEFPPTYEYSEEGFKEVIQK